MQFDDILMSAHLDGRRYTLRVRGEALHVLWGEGAGPQTGPLLAEENRAFLTQLAAHRVTLGEVDSDIIVITPMDVEG